MSSSKKAALAIGYAVLWIGAVFPVRAQATFYYSSPLTQKQDPQDFAGLDGSINLKRVPPSTSAAEAEGRFPARAAAALFYSANHLELLVSPEDRTPGHPCHAVPKG